MDAELHSAKRQGTPAFLATAICLSAIAIVFFLEATLSKLSQVGGGLLIAEVG